jgi:LuxR family maltose regulon positive regulatory protein
VEHTLRDAVATAALTLVQAPLGAGKSTAAAAALSGRRDVAWVDAKPWHRAAPVAAIVEAARGVRGDFGRMTLGALASGANGTHVARIFCEELTHVDTPLLVVVDNAHEFGDDDDFSRFVKTSIAISPPNVRMMIVGRRLPDLATGESLARRRTALVDAQLFAFTEDEVALLAGQLGRELDARAVREIMQATQGWAAGVLLALASPNPMAPAGAGPRSAAAAFLAEELLPTLAPGAIAFLEQTSVFETIDLRVITHGAAFPDAPERISELQHSGALVSDLGAGRFRIHPVLRELAQSGLRLHGSPEAAHREAATAYARAGEISAALFHASAAGDASVSAAFLRTYAEAAIATGDRARVRALAASIDPAGRDGDIRAYADGLLEKARGVPEARAAFTRAAQAADVSGDAAIAFGARAHVVELDIGRLARIDGVVLDDLRSRAASLGSEQRGTAAMLRGWARAVAHDFDGALSAVERLAGTGDAATRFNIGILQAYAQTARGEADAAEETLDALIRLLEDDDRVVLQTLTLVWFSRLALTWGRTTAAADAAAQARRLATALDLRAEEAALYVALAELATHAGEAEAAAAYADRARARAKNAWYAADVQRVRAFSEIVLARAAFLRGEYALARDVAARLAAAPGTPGPQRALALAEGSVYTLLSDAPAAREAIAAARRALGTAVPLDAGDAVAIAVADDVLAFLDAANGTVRRRIPLHCDAFAGLLESRRGLATLELAGVAVANARAGTAGAESFEAVLELLTRYGPRFEARLVRAYALRFVKPLPQAAPALPTFDLTPREHEILALLVDGLTNKEIAQRLIVSPRTAETHVERILGKLEVGSRSRAIAKAIRLGLVSLEPSL